MQTLMKLKAILVIVLLVIIVVLAGCAKDVRVRYAVVPDESGTVVIKLSAPMEKVSVTVDDNMVVEDAHTQRIQVENVPVGKRKIHIIAESGERKEKLDKELEVIVKSNETSAVLVEVPPYSIGYYIYWVILVLVPWIPLLAK